MQIGLMRHFPVEQAFPSGWRTAEELQEWRRNYESSPAIPGSTAVDKAVWPRCLSSDVERAVVTARTVFAGPFEQTALLREPDFATFRTGNLRLPVWLWRQVLRLAWLSGHRSQRRCRDEFQSRVRQVADLLVEGAGENILVVSHAGMMAYLSRELVRRGFAGPKLRVAKHAVLYVYQKP